MEPEIPVAHAEQFATYRQVIRPPDQEGVALLLTALHRILRSQRFTGKVTLNLNQGGVRDLITEQVTAVRPGSEADIALEKNFSK